MNLENCRLCDLMRRVKSDGVTVQVVAALIEYISKTAEGKKLIAEEVAAEQKAKAA